MSKARAPPHPPPPPQRPERRPGQAKSLRRPKMCGECRQLHLWCAMAHLYDVRKHVWVGRTTGCSWRLEVLIPLREDTEAGVSFRPPSCVV